MIRRESAEDAGAVRDVQAAAFARPGAATPPEVVLIDRLRAGAEWIPRLSLVAVVTDEVIGHVVCTRAWVGDRAVLGLGPLGVLPAHQGRATGSALVRAVVAAADALKAPLIGLLGAVGYYRRFGFVTSHHLGISPPDPGWGDHFQVLPLTTHEPSLTGPFRYAPAFRDLPGE